MTIKTNDHNSAHYCTPDPSTWEEITSTKYKLDAHSKGLEKDEGWLGLGVLAVVCSSTSVPT